MRPVHVDTVLPTEGITSCQANVETFHRLTEAKFPTLSSCRMLGHVLYSTQYIISIRIFFSNTLSEQDFFSSPSHSTPLSFPQDGSMVSREQCIHHDVLTLPRVKKRYSEEEKGISCVSNPCFLQPDGDNVIIRPPEFFFPSVETETSMHNSIARNSE